MTVNRGSQQGNHVLFLMNFEDGTQAIPVDAPLGSSRLVLSTDDPRYAGEPGSEAPSAALEVLQGRPAVVKCPGQASLIYARAGQPPSS